MILEDETNSAAWCGRAEGFRRMLPRSAALAQLAELRRLRATELNKDDDGAADTLASLRADFDRLAPRDPAGGAAEDAPPLAPARPSPPSPLLAASEAVPDAAVASAQELSAALTARRGRRIARGVTSLAGLHEKALRLLAAPRARPTPAGPPTTRPCVAARGVPPSAAAARLLRQCGHRRDCALRGRAEAAPRGGRRARAGTRASLRTRMKLGEYEDALRAPDDAARGASRGSSGGCRAAAPRHEARPRRMSRSARRLRHARHVRFTWRMIGATRAEIDELVKVGAAPSGRPGPTRRRSSGSVGVRKAQAG